MVDMLGSVQGYPGQIIQAGVDHLQEAVSSGKMSVEELKNRLTRRFGEEANNAFNQDGTVDFDAVKALFQGNSNGAAPAAADGTAQAANPAQLIQLLAQRLGVTEPDITDESGNISQEKMNLLLEQIRSNAQGLWDTTEPTFQILA